MFRPLRLLVVAASAMLATACGLHRGGSTPPTAIVIFDNQSLEQADVFAVSSGGSPIRIGTVFAGHRQRLNVRGTALGTGGTVNIVARLLVSARAPRTGTVSLAPGDRLEVTLTPDGNYLAALPLQ